MEYIVEKDEFDFDNELSLHTGKTELSVKVRFSFSCLYEDIDKERDWNKLVGWSYGILPFVREGGNWYNKNDWEPAHHRNSIRIVWRSNKKRGTIELGLYYYRDKVRYVKQLCEVLPEYDVDIKLLYYEHMGTIVTFITQSIVEGFPKLIHHSETNTGYDVKWGYMLYPYFGGTNPAPHKLSLTMVFVT